MICNFSISKLVPLVAVTVDEIFIAATCQVCLGRLSSALGEPTVFLSLLLSQNSVLLWDSVNRSSASPDVGLSIFPDSAGNNGT